MALANRLNVDLNKLGLTPKLPWQEFINVRDVYAEAKSNVFDVKALRSIIRIRKKNDQERIEEETVLATYMHALGMIDVG